MNTQECYKCKKSLSNPAGGIYSGSSLFGMISNTPYQCKTCGASYCLDCMTELKKKGAICPNCSSSVGW